MQKAPPTPKGFRDIAPDLAKKRQQVISQIVKVLEDFGFEPIETPTIEFSQTLKGKYGEEERLIYEFKDRGGRNLALRYDLTVPLARYVATYNPPLPFRRYQIGQVFRGENPQHGRYREFTQLDFDSVGSDSLEEDAKIIAAAIKAVKKIGVINPQMKINDRQNFAGLGKKVIIALDKLEKIGESAVVSELIQKGLSENKAAELLTSIRNKKPTDDLEKIFKHLEILGVDKKEYAFDPYLARGLDYYTGAIFELRVPSYGNLSIGSGGRYDNLIGMLSKKQIPAVGFSFGLDRLIEALGEN
ncbi:histidine--tRNA ligase [Candidatus Curtissbacteria bacterium RIFCSPLOWO2_02_41_11]|uniref:Histidine--tRNA ligase n=2 Tax=Candidatus Curtissiibacteriota TaxID=1752717 RepID=A0A1F5HUH3_9BACT|nr:MAG: Histidyl-tRNA synthetase [Candidatus Curtissbacteria bacterium GW2011_GWA2_41_24]OGE07817.1 MAG: histidine--tRNA ligase [Candidatus Curtissbacteria bacterium RIFCSPLOWO2_02_41_11]